MFSEMDLSDGEWRHTYQLVVLDKRGRFVTVAVGQSWIGALVCVCVFVSDSDLFSVEQVGGRGERPWRGGGVLNRHLQQKETLVFELLIFFLSHHPFLQTHTPRNFTNNLKKQRWEAQLVIGLCVVEWKVHSSGKKRTCLWV